VDSSAEKNMAANSTTFFHRDLAQNHSNWRGANYLRIFSSYYIYEILQVTLALTAGPYWPAASCDVL